MNQTPDPLDLTISERAALSDLRCVFERMANTEKMAACLLLFRRAVLLTDEITDLVEADVTVKGSSQFNEQIKDVEVLTKEVLTPEALTKFIVDVLQLD